jgi:hypothetical protein
VYVVVWSVIRTFETEEKKLQVTEWTGKMVGRYAQLWTVCRLNRNIAGRRRRWYLLPCDVVTANVLEVPAASIFRIKVQIDAVCFSKTLVST